MSTYHGVKPVTDDDKDMAEKHLKKTLKLKEKAQDLNREKIEDHREALKDAVKDGDKRSANYNRSHLEGHEKDLDDIDKEQHKIHQSLSTLGTLRTHSRRTYNDVRKAKVQLMYRKANAGMAGQASSGAPAGGR